MQARFSPPSQPSPVKGEGVGSLGQEGCQSCWKRGEQPQGLRLLAAEDGVGFYEVGVYFGA